MYAADTPIRTGRSAGTARSVAVIPVATATRTTDVPTTIPARYASERRTPKAAPVAVRLMVAGPGLPMIAADVTSNGPTEPHRIPARGGSGTAVAIPSEHAGDATRRRRRSS